MLLVSGEGLLHACISSLSLATGIYIDEWKQARVTPIFKSGDRGQYENYRPISILPVVSKVFEREVFRQLYSYLTENSKVPIWISSKALDCNCPHPNVR